MTVRPDPYDGAVVAAGSRFSSRSSWHPGPAAQTTTRGAQTRDGCATPPTDVPGDAEHTRDGQHYLANGLLRWAADSIESTREWRAYDSVKNERKHWFRTSSGCSD